MKMVTPNHIKHKPVRSNASPLIQKMVVHTNLKTKDEDEEEAVDCDMDHDNPMAPFFLASADLAGTTISTLFATWMSLSPTLQVWSLSQRGTTRPWHRPLLHSGMEPSP